MATTQTNQPYTRTIHFKYVAEWRWVDVRASASPAATPFGPPFELRPGEQEPATGCPSPKPVVYMPVKRTKRQQIVPSLGIFVSFWEEGNLLNVSVTAHRGAAVKVEVWNVFRGERKGPLSLDGKLDDHGRCFIKVPAETVAKWLDAEKPGPLGGRINELLLDFSFSCPDLKVNGQPLKGQSINRAFLYRRKVIVFLPGVFGSKVQVTTPDGRQLGYPDWYSEPSALQGALESLLGPVALPHTIARQGIHAINQRLGGLECDWAGKPLLKPVKAFIFSLLGLVYDVFDRCREARAAYFDMPNDFRLVELRLFAYDWRGDLTESAVALAKALAAQAESLRRLPDTDDEVAVSGHSTGGVIIRRALGEPAMKDLVSHAFFMNVPFRGAPKALGVALTGKDPIGGGFMSRMIPFIDPDSLSSLALSMPIVYHLASSNAYGEQIAFTPDRGGGAPTSVEKDKDALITAALQAGLTPPQFVKAAGLSDEERAGLAMTADEWHAYYREAFERHRAQEIYAAVFPHGLPKREGWFKAEMKARGLELQFAARSTGGWNRELAARAQKFHEESEAIARSGAWADKAYVFYSLTEAPTTLSTHLERVSEAEYPNIAAFLKAERIPMLAFERGEAVPPSGTEKITLADGRSAPALTWHQWTVTADGRYKRTVWRIYVVNRPKSGDSTVPVRSLLGFGGRAHVFKPTDKPHPEATDDVRVWTGVIRVLQGVARDGEDFQVRVDTEHGVAHG
jgi:hypothetical protein